MNIDCKLCVPDMIGKHGDLLEGEINDIVNGDGNLASFYRTHEESPPLSGRYNFTFHIRGDLMSSSIFKLFEIVEDFSASLTLTTFREAPHGND